MIPRLFPGLRGIGVIAREYRGAGGFGVVARPYAGPGLSAVARYYQGAGGFGALPAGSYSGQIGQRVHVGRIPIPVAAPPNLSESPERVVNLGRGVSLRVRGR